MSTLQLDIRAKRMLLFDWFAHLARESKLGLDLTQHGASGQAFTLGPGNNFHVTAQFIDTPPFLSFVSSDPGRQALVDSIVPKAIDHLERADFGGVVWYSTKLDEVELKLFGASLLGSLLERLGSQTRFTGWRRLGGHVLLEFTETLPATWDESTALLAPKAAVQVHIAAPGPCAGHFSSHIAHGVTETVAAICSFALGRSLLLPPVVFPAKPEKLSELAESQTDSKILTLARKHISLDILSVIGTAGGLEVFKRGRAALMTFDAAARQEHDSIACILYVVAAESLTTPYTQWKDSKLTKRFIEFFNELMPTELDQLVAHGNFEETFGIVRGTRTANALRKDLLDRIYDYRSGQLHEGLRPNYGGLGVAQDMLGGVRRLPKEPFFSIFLRHEAAL